jgi:hypothetical protein
MNLLQIMMNIPHYIHHNIMFRKMSSKEVACYATGGVIALATVTSIGNIYYDNKKHNILREKLASSMKKYNNELHNAVYWPPGGDPTYYVKYVESSEIQKKVDKNLEFLRQMPDIINILINDQLWLNLDDAIFKLPQEFHTPARCAKLIMANPLFILQIEPKMLVETLKLVPDKDKDTIKKRLIRDISSNTNYRSFALIIYVVDGSIDKPVKLMRNIEAVIGSDQLTKALHGCIINSFYFNKLFGNKLVKITITNESGHDVHHRMTYDNAGEYTDILPFYPRGTCTPGGIHFMKEADYGKMYESMECATKKCNKRSVKVPENVPVYIDGNSKFKAPKIILGERKN